MSDLRGVFFFLECGALLCFEVRCAVLFSFLVHWISASFCFFLFDFCCCWVGCRVIFMVCF